MASYWKLASGSYRIRAYDGGGKCQYETVPASEVASLTPAKLEKELTRRATLFANDAISLMLLGFPAFRQTKP